MGRPKKTATKTTKSNDPHKTPAVGFRIPTDVLRAFDAYVEWVNAKAPPGFSTSRNALVIEYMRKAAAEMNHAKAAAEPAPEGESQPS